jgi:cytochrome c-type biogenesis protein CcmH/NrfF
VTRFAPALLVACVTCLAIAAVAAAAEPRASLTDIEDEVMCPICGTPLNLAEAPQAERERAFIRRQIARGETKQEILDTLVAEYGPEVLATPEDEGFDLAAWLVPAGGLAIAAAVLFVGVRRWRRRDIPSAPRPGETGLDPDEAERLRSDLAKYDL